MPEPSVEPALFPTPAAPAPSTPERLKQRLERTEKLLELSEAEIQRLHLKLAAMTRQLAEKDGRDAQLALEAIVEELRESELARIRRELAEMEADDEKAPHQKKKRSPRRGHGPTPQDALPVVEEIVELAPEQYECQVCGGQMVAMGEQFEESEEIDVIERRYVLKKVKRRKARCACNGNVQTAPAPPRLIRGGRYSIDFAVQVAADKYLDHAPLERQTRMMQRLGLQVGSNTLFDQAQALSDRLRDVYDHLGAIVLDAPILHVDETRWPRLDRKANSNWTVWSRTTPDIAHYAILPSRSKSAGEYLLKGYRGTIVVDGYEVYESLARDGPDLNLANCWAHVRRKLEDERANHPKLCGQGLALIRDLYEVEAEVEGPFPGSPEAQALRHALRQKKSAPILDAIWDWALNVGALPRSGLGKLVRYMLKRKSGLSRFLTDARIPLDNNAAERSLRGLVVGRKVHYGSKSKRGTEVAAILYTLFETAKLVGVEPVGYLRAAVHAALESPGRVLLPHDYRVEAG